MDSENTKRRPLTEEEKQKIQNFENNLNNIINMCDGFLTMIDSASASLMSNNIEEVNNHLINLKNEAEKYGSETNEKNKDGIIGRIGNLGEAFAGSEEIKKILNGRFQRSN